MLVKSLCEAYLRYHPENQYRADFRLSHRDLYTNMCTRNQGKKKSRSNVGPYQLFYVALDVLTLL